MNWEEWLSKNPNRIVSEFGANEEKAAAAAQVADESKKNLSRNFEYHWKVLGGPTLLTEYRFHDTRRWRFDYAHPATRTAIELEGGVWTGGRHVRGHGYVGDCEKYNAAAAAGWMVWRLPSDLVEASYIQGIIDYIKVKGG